MSGCCGSLKTSGLSHNKNSKTYVPTRADCNLQSLPNKKIPKNKTQHLYFVSNKCSEHKTSITRG